MNWLQFGKDDEMGLFTLRKFANHVCSYITAADSGTCGIKIQAGSYSWAQNPYSCVARLYNRLPVSIRVEHNYSRFVKTLKAFIKSHKFHAEVHFVHGRLCNMKHFTTLHSVIACHICK